MTITTTGLTRAAGFSAAAAGLIFIAVQINHPPMDATSVATTEWVVRNSAKVLMGALALVGITGMYLRQVRQAGLLGLVGYLLFGKTILCRKGEEGKYKSLVDLDRPEVKVMVNPGGTNEKFA